MSVEQRMYQGNLISRLTQMIDSHFPPERKYALQNSSGHVFGPAVLMTETQAASRNANMPMVTDYRWTLIIERTR